MQRVQVKKNSYYDSVTLMLISRDVKKLPGVTEVMVGMGTDLNLELTEKLGIQSPELAGLTSNDFFIAAEVESQEVMDEVIAKVEELLTKKNDATANDYRPSSLGGAVETMEGLNMAVISVAGKYAAAEAHQALDKGLHVMMFSDNVSVEDERKLKEKAVEKGLLMMGPDCGTAIINGVALAFANVIKRGNIGIVGASGTGTQEVSVLIDKLGGGVSQVIGTGGRDLKEDIGGLMMIQSFEALVEDPATSVIVLISKPPAESVAAKIYDMVKTCPKPVVVDFIGADPQPIRQAGGFPCVNLEHAAQQAVALSRGQTPQEYETLDDSWQAKARELGAKLKPEQQYLLGLYTGGTLADEAIKLLMDQLGGIYSNIAFDKEHQMDDLNNFARHVVLDLGDDRFTEGRPHPMIDPLTRSERFETDVTPETAVILFDCVLGYGAHEDPAAEVALALTDVKAKLQAQGLDMVAVGSICGTEADPQDLQKSQQVLEEAGAVILLSNAKAVEFAGLILGSRR